jgi:hypothetical protein
MKIGRGTKVLGENLPQRHFVHHKIPHDQTRARTPDRSGGKPATNRLSYGAAPNVLGYWRRRSVCYSGLFATSLVVTTISFYNVLGPSDVASRSGPGSSALDLWSSVIRSSLISVGLSLDMLPLSPVDLPSVICVLFCYPWNRVLAHQKEDTMS